MQLIDQLANVTGLGNYVDGEKWTQSRQVAKGREMNHDSKHHPAVYTHARTHTPTKSLEQRSQNSEAYGNTDRLW